MVFKATARDTCVHVIYILEHFLKLSKQDSKKIFFLSAFMLKSTQLVSLAVFSKLSITL